MSTPVPLQAVGDRLGRSLFYEEHKGDFAQARSAARVELDRARREGTPASLADALIARGIVHALQGEPPAALACFEEAGGLVPGDDARQLRVLSFSALANYRCFMAMPGDGGSLPLEVQARWDPQAYVQRMEPQWLALEARVGDPGVRSEAALAYRFLRDLLAVRSILDNLYIVDPEEAGRKLVRALQVPEQLRVLAGSREDGAGLLAYADVATADLLRRGRQAEAAGQFLGRAGNTYKQAGDLAGLAACFLLWGDWLAAPCSSHLVWNHHIEEGTRSNELSWLRESEELDRRGDNPEAAEAAYAEAERLFAAAGAPRGLAGVRLRRGYLASLAGDYAEAGRLAAEAAEAFEACGDGLAARLALAHAAIARVGAGQLPEDIDAADAVGAWGRDEGSFSFALEGVMNFSPVASVG